MATLPATRIFSGVPEPDVQLRPWRVDDAPAIGAMTEQVHILRWSSMDGNVAAWIGREQAGARGSSLAV